MSLESMLPSVMINQDNVYELMLAERPSRPSLRLYIFFGMTTVALIAFTVLEIIFRDQMFYDSIKFSVKMQQQTPNAGTISNVIGEIITGVGIAYVALCIFIRKQKCGPFRRFLALALIIWLNVTLRLIYANTRPSFKSLELQGSGPFCETDFGNPSGHSIMVVALHLLVFMDIREHRKNPGVIFDSIGLTCVAILGLSVIFIRLYLGVHAYSQLILGSLWSVFGVLLIEVLRLEINWYILEPIFYKEIRFNLRKTVYIILLVVIGVFNALAFLFFGLRLHTHGVESEFYNEIVNCLEVKENYLENFATRILASGLIFNFILFMFLGLNHCPKNVRVGLDFVSEGRIFRILLRFLVLVLLAVPIIFAFVPKDGIVAVTIVRSSIIFPADGYIEGRFLVPLLMKFKLVKTRDLEPHELEPPIEMEELEPPIEMQEIDK